MVYIGFMELTKFSGHGIAPGSNCPRRFNCLSLVPLAQLCVGPQGFGAGAMAAYSALVSVVVGISFAAGRYFGAPQQRAQVPSYGSSMHMAAMMDDDDDENDLMGLLGLAEVLLPFILLFSCSMPFRGASDAE